MDEKTTTNTTSNENNLNNKTNDISTSNNINSCEKNMRSVLECPFCGEIFNKHNKPMVLKCTHSICNNCLKLNLITQSKCLTCDTKITEQDIKKFATNFLLLEIIEKTHKSNENNIQSGAEKIEKPISKKKVKKVKEGKDGKEDKNTNEVDVEDEANFEKVEEQAFMCIECNVAIINKDFHLSKFPGHTFSNYKNILDERVQKIKDKQKNIMDEYYAFNKSFNDTHNAFIDFIISNFYSQVEELKKKVKDYDFFEVMNFVGFISKSDIDKLNSFRDMFFKDEKFVKALKNSESFEELFSNFTKENIDEKDYNSFFENYFEIESILNVKLNNVEEKLVTLEERIGKLDKEKVIKELIEDIGVQVYDSLNLDTTNSNHSFKYAHYITKNKNLIVFNPISEQIEVVDLKELLPEKYHSLEMFSTLLDIDKILYIAGGKFNDVASNIFIEILIEKKQFKELKPMSTARVDPIMIAINNKVLVFGGKGSNGESLNSSESYDIISCEWKNLPNNNFLSEAKTKPQIINWNKNNCIYLFENLKVCSSYSIKEQKWKNIKMLYTDAFDLNTTKYSLIEKDDNIYFYGGVDSKNSTSDKIYYFQTEDKQMSLKGNLCSSCSFDSNSFSLFSYNNCFLMNVIEGMDKEYQITIMNCNDFKAQKWNSYKELTIKDN